MNIAIDVRSLAQPVRTGVGENTIGLLSALLERPRGHTFVLFYNAFHAGGYDVTRWQSDHVRVVRTRYPNKILHASMLAFGYPKLDAFLSAKAGVGPIDVFFSPNLHITALGPVPRVLTIHDLSFLHAPDFYSPRSRWWHRAVRAQKQCREANAIITFSESTRSDVIETVGVAADRVHVVSVGVSEAFRRGASADIPSAAAAELQKKYNVPERYIFSLGTIEPRKNYDALLAAFIEFRKQYPTHDLVVAGALGWKGKDIVRRLSAVEGVRYIGYIDEADKPLLYRQASLFVYPSLYEGFGLPVLEAALCGVPVVTSNRTSLPAVIGDAAYLAHPYNAADIARGMAILMREPDRGRAIREGRARAKSHHWQTAADQLLDIFDRVRI